MLQVIPRHINNGKLTRLGDLGTFRLTFKGEGAESPEAVTEKNIKSTRLIFRPGKEFRKALKAIQYGIHIAIGVLNYFLIDCFSR